MGAEFGQWQEWTFRHSLDWHLLDYDRHRLLSGFFKSMNAYYLTRPCLWEEDDSWAGFQWLSADDKARCTIAYLRRDSAGRALLVACNFSGEHHSQYRVGVPYGSTWTVDLSTDAWEFGGSGRGSTATIKSEPVTANGYGQSVVLDLPPMTAIILRCVRKHPVRTPRGLRKPRKPAPAKKSEP
jgi:1,4-alpha-glucan branching enzyme